MSGTKYIASNWRVPENSNSSKNDNYSLSFDGNEYINCGVINQVQTFSVSMWVNPLNWSQRRVALQMGQSSNYGLSFWFMSDGTLRCVGANVTNDSYFGSIVANADTYLPSGSWGHILFTHEQTGTGATQKIYINGTLRNTYTSTTNPYTINYLGNPLYIARRNNDIDRWLGNIGEVAIFDYALSDPQIIESLAGRPETGAENPMVLKPTPVAYYPLGDNSSGGIDVGPTSILTQPNVAVDDASVFDFNASSNQEIDCGDILHNDGQTPMTISAWVKISTAAGHTNSAPIASKKKTRKAPTYIMDGWEAGFVTSGAQTNRLHFSILGDGTVATGHLSKKALTLSFTDGLWHHVVITYDGSEDAAGVKFYIDGTEDTTTQTLSNTLSGTIPNAPSEHFMIGETPKYGGTNWMDGEMSNLQIWDVKLEDAEVLTLYNDGVPLLIGTQPQAANLEAWYKLDQSANWEADTVGNWQIPDAVSAYPQSFKFARRDSGYNGRAYLGDGSLTFNDKISASIWVRIDLSAGNNYQLLFAQTDGTNNSWSIGLNSTNKIWYRIWNADGSVNSDTNNSGTGIKDGKWHHVVLIYDGTSNVDGIKLFLDGKLEAQLTASSTGIDAQSLKIALANSSLPTQQSAAFNVGLANTQIWDTDLSYGTVTTKGDVAGGDVATLYNNGIPYIAGTQPETANLKGWWKLDDTSTFSTNWTFLDALGSGNDGVSAQMTERELINNNVSALNGESSGMTSGNLVLSDLTRNLPYENYSMDFDGTETVLCQSDLAGDLNQIDGAITVSCWVKTTQGAVYENMVTRDAFGGSNQDWSLIKDNFFPTAASGGAPLWQLWNTNSDNLKVKLTSANDPAGNPIIPINDGNWHHVVGVYDGSDTASLYTDGVLQGTTTLAGFGSFPLRKTRRVCIGGQNNGSLPTALVGSWTGGISNTAIWDIALSPTEVLKLHANGLPQDLTNFTPQPMSWYPMGKQNFWDGSDWIVTDPIGSNDGTSTNMAVSDLVGDAPRSEANGTGTNMDIPTNLVGNAGFSDKNAYSINMGPEARVTDTP